MLTISIYQYHNFRYFSNTIEFVFQSSKILNVTMALHLYVFSLKSYLYIFLKFL